MTSQHRRTPGKLQLGWFRHQDAYQSLVRRFGIEGQAKQRDPDLLGEIEGTLGP